MKFRKFGKALLMTAISAGLVFGISSCVQSYSVGYLYVTGTQTASTAGEGVISGFKIDHNTGNLIPINGLPVSTGGSNPGRFVILTNAGSRFLYVLNRGSHTDGSDCTAANPCTNANIVQFAIGGNGVLAPQQTFYTQGLNPFRILPDAGGTHLYVLDHDAPDSTGCSLVFGSSVTTCGDITAFQIDASTGRLSYVLNSQVTAASGAPLTYFPVPANPIDFAVASNVFYTLSSTSTVDSVFPYSLNPSNGQLTITQNTPQPLGMSHATAIVPTTAGVVYVLDNGPNSNGNGSTGQIFAYTATNGSLQAETSGLFAVDPTQSNPIYVLSVNSGKNLYVLDQGDNQNTTISQSGISAFTVVQPFNLLPIANQGQTAGTGPGPQCMLEDPSKQFIYTANFNDGSVTGLSIDVNNGNLRPLTQSTHAKGTYKLPGPAAWCDVSGRTS